MKGDDPRLASLIYAWYKAHHYWPSTGPVYSKQAYDQLAAFWKAHGVIEGSVPPYSQVWDARFWRRAVSR